jgi:hypothetical protein
MISWDWSVLEFVRGLFVVLALDRFVMYPTEAIHVLLDMLALISMGEPLLEGLEAGCVDWK